MDMPEKFPRTNFQIKIYQKFIETAPNHQTFVDILGGDLGIIAAKIPSPIDTFNDIHQIMFDFSQTIINEKQCKTLASDVMPSPPLTNCIKETPHHVMDYYYRLSKVYSNFEKNDILLDRLNLKEHPWLNTLPMKNFYKLYNKLLNVQYEEQDIATIAKRYDREETLFYFDLSENNMYPIEEDLTEIIKNITGKFWLIALKEEADKYKQFSTKQIEFKIPSLYSDQEEIEYAILIKDKKQSMKSFL